MDKMPKYKKFIKEIEGGDLYYDYGADYYFLVQRNNKNESKNMTKKNTIRLTESELKKVITESVKKVLNELDPRTYQWASNERQKRNADVYNQYDPETGESNSQYAAKYKKQGNGDVVRGAVKNAYQQRQNQNTAQQSWAKREQNIGTQQANVEKVNLQKGNYEYVKGYGWCLRKIRYIKHIKEDKKLKEMERRCKNDG
jgi:hypothetical protein